MAPTLITKNPRVEELCNKMNKEGLSEAESTELFNLSMTEIFERHMERTATTLHNMGVKSKESSGTIWKKNMVTGIDDMHLGWLEVLWVPLGALAIVILLLFFILK